METEVKKKNKQPRLDTEEIHLVSNKFLSYTSLLHSNIESGFTPYLVLYCKYKLQ